MTFAPVIGAPPSKLGHNHESCTAPFEATAVRSVAGSATVYGIDGADAVDSALVPAAFATATVKEYETPFVSPETTHCVALPISVLHVNPDGEAVTTAPVSWLPPLNEGRVHETETRPSPAIASILVGASGIVNGVTGTEGNERGELPAKLAAVTVKTYDVPLDSPSTSHDVDAWEKVVHCWPPGLDVTV
jgi:hypothetical protein